MKLIDNIKAFLSRRKHQIFIPFFAFSILFAPFTLVDPDIYWTQIPESEGPNGRLVIPTINYTARLAAGYYGQLQSVADKQDSAIIRPMEILDSNSATLTWNLENWEYLILGDHNFYGLERSIDLEKGDKAYIIQSGEIVITMTCLGKCYGQNKDTYLTTEEKIPEDTVALIYTCAPEGKGHIIITFWSVDNFDYKLIEGMN